LLTHQVLHTYLGSRIPERALSKRILAHNNLALPAVERKPINREGSHCRIDFQAKLDLGRIGIGRLADNVQVLSCRGAEVGGENLAGRGKRGTGADTAGEVVVRCGV
jgi:hypothetical protein